MSSLLKKISVCSLCQKIPTLLFLLFFYLYGSTFLLWNILFPFLMHMEAYMVAHLEIPSRMQSCVLFGKCPNPGKRLVREQINCWKDARQWLPKAQSIIHPHFTVERPIPQHMRGDIQSEHRWLWASTDILLAISLWIIGKYEGQTLFFSWDPLFFFLFFFFFSFFLDKVSWLLLKKCYLIACN